MFKALISNVKLQAHKIGAIVLTAFMVSTLSMGLASAQSAGFISPSDAPTSVQASTGGADNARVLVRRIVDFFLGFLGFLSVLIIIYGGVLILISAGEPDKAEKGKKILLYAVLGIVMILLSYAVVNTVLQAGTGNAA